VSYGLEDLLFVHYSILISSLLLASALSTEQSI